jgi:hypothetical protein
MYEKTTSTTINRKSDNDKRDKLCSSVGSPLLGAQSLRMGCPACDRKRSGVCGCHKAADRSNTATAI